MVLAAMAVVVVIALIPTNPKSRDIFTKPSPVDWAAVKDDPSQKLTLTWQAIISYPSALPGSWIERNLDKRFNVKFEPIFLNVSSYSIRRPMMLCGGNVPDIMWSGDPLQIRANVRNGFVMELPYRVILKHYPTYVKWVNKYGKEAWLYAEDKGRNFGLPTIVATAIRPRIGCWCMDWLHNVGINRVPETVQ